MLSGVGGGCSVTGKLWPKQREPLSMIAVTRKRTKAMGSKNKERRWRRKKKHKAMIKIVNRLITGMM